MESYGVSIQMKPPQQHFHVMLSVLQVVLTFESVEEILWGDHSNETSSVVLSYELLLSSIRPLNHWYNPSIPAV